MKITFPVKSFRRLDDPYNPDDIRKKYRFYVNAKDVPSELREWMQTNPREQKLTTDVANAIRTSLIGNNKSFHLWNRGILLSVEDIEFDNKTNNVTLNLTKPDIHGNIDGGHTFRVIVEAQEKDVIKYNQFVDFEVITGLDRPEQLADARNTSVQVDTKSIEELKDSFDCIKKAIDDTSFAKRIAYKQNEHYEDGSKNIIDVREIIAITNMFSLKR